MSEINRIFRGQAGRKPSIKSKSGNQIASYLEGYVRNRGICTSGEIVNEGMKHFKLSRSQIYTTWSKIKKNKVLKATKEELKQFGISDVKGNTTYWIHIDNSKIRDEFRELIAALARADTKKQFLVLLRELRSSRFHDFLIGGPIDETDLLLCLLLLMLNNTYPTEISPICGQTTQTIDRSQITDFAHEISDYLRTIYLANNYMSKKYESLFFLILKDTLNKVVVEDQTNSNILGLAKDLSFIASDVNKEKFNEIIFSSFKQNLIKNSVDYDKIYGGIINIESILSYLMKESGQKKLEYRFWNYMWKIVIFSCDKVPEDRISQDEKRKVSETIHIMINGETSIRPNLYNDIQKIIEQIRDLSE
jgi:hypothetical protein